MNKPYTVIGYQWQSNDIYGHNIEYSQQPLTYYVHAETPAHASHVAEIRHTECYEEDGVECQNFVSTLVISGHPDVTRLW
jgi:hypothetical protein